MKGPIIVTLMSLCAMLGFVGGAWFAIDTARTIQSDKKAPLADHLALPAFSIEGLVSAQTAGELAHLRQLLVRHIWHQDELPTDAQPYRVAAAQDARWDDLEGLLRTDRLDIALEYDLRSVAYHFIPQSRTGRLMIVHQGHSGDFINSKHVIAHYLAAGYDIIALAMPLMGPNALKNQWLETKKFGPIFIPDVPDPDTFHSYIALLAREDFNPLELYVHPVVVALNYALKLENFKSVSMVGVSGGGWTTVFASAVDERIQNSFQIAGGLPFYLRAMRPVTDMGDYEQHALNVYTVANYLELYLLSSLGEGRTHTQIIIANDPCCFAQPDAAQVYHDALRRIRTKNQLPGQLNLRIDAAHMEHSISPHALELIDDVLAAAD